MFAPESVSVPAPFLVSEPWPPTVPAELPLETVKVLAEAIVTVPPVSVVIEEVSPKLTVPALSTPRADVPVTVVVPPEMDEELSEPAVTTALPEITELKLPVTLTLPCEIPPVTLALLAKLVVPLPERLAAVMVVLAPVKLKRPALVTAPMFKLVPEILAVPLESSERLAALVPPKLTALKIVALVPPDRLMPEVPANAPEVAVRVPLETVVNPE